MYMYVKRVWLHNPRGNPVHSCTCTRLHVQFSTCLLIGMKGTLCVFIIHVHTCIIIIMYTVIVFIVFNGHV